MTHLTAVPYFYDKQIRRYLEQFIRLFSGFQYVKGYTENGDPVMHMVPVRQGDMNRVAAHILKENSGNMINTVPMISCYITGLQPRDDYRTYQQFEDNVPVIEKNFDEETQQYINEKGNTYTIKRYQPVPYTLSVQVDIWTSNLEQKMQLLEQILVLFNPTLNIHTNDNAFDWSSLSYVKLAQTNWSNRVIPQGVDDIIDICTLNFEVTAYINPAAKVLKNSMIHTIINNLTAIPTETADEVDIASDIYNLSPIYTAYVVVTLERYKIKFEVDDDGVATAQIRNQATGTTDSDGNLLVWEDVLKPFGKFRPDISQVRFKTTANPGAYLDDIIGTLSYHPTDPTKFLVDIDMDTLPANTQAAVDNVIDPEYNYPGDGTISSPALGDRYLILNEIPHGSAWNGALADANDIIEYNGLEWFVSFDASETTDEDDEYTFNIHTNDKLKWTGTEWINAYEGMYNGGYWRIYL